MTPEQKKRKSTVIFISIFLAAIIARASRGFLEEKSFFVESLIFIVVFVATNTIANKFFRNQKKIIKKFN